MNKKCYSVAIDGPAGAGKSTMARRAAQTLNFVYVDTGAIYRTVAYAALSRGISPENGEVVAALLPEIRLDLSWQDGIQHMLLNGCDVTAEIRKPEISDGASKVAALPVVLDFLMETQRNAAKTHSVIMDGRDIGTVVLPRADVKIFLTASAEQHAQRRYLELTQKGEHTTLAKVLEEMQKRDKQDSTRACAPLKPAKDAVLLDTSELDVEQSAQRILKIIREKLA